MADLLSAGKAMLDEMFGKLPEDKRVAAQALFSDPAVAPAVETLGNGTLRRADHSRAMDTVAQEEARLKAYHQQQQDWWNANQTDAELGKQARARGWSPETPATTPPTTELPPDLVRRADVDKLINERERQAVGFFNLQSRLAFEHFRTFGEALDLEALTADPRAGTLGLEGVYRARYADQYATLAKAAEDKRVDAIVQERLTTERRKYANQPPGAISHGTSPLEALSPTPDGKPGLVDEAVDEYHRLTAARA